VTFLMSNTVVTKRSDIVVTRKEYRLTKAKPKWQLGAQTCAKRKSTSPCQPYLHLTAQLGSITDTLTLTGEYANANDFEVRPRALTDLSKD
jgi:hypothetical protein